MNKILYSILLSASVLVGMASCSNGDYVANPDSNGNNSVNPLNPLTAADFVWSGNDPVSCKINGSLWVADTAFYFLDTSGANNIYAFKDSFRQEMVFHLLNTWSGNLYNMGHLQYNTMVTWIPNTLNFLDTGGAYLSTLGNSAELYMIANDTINANFTGKFYAQTVNAKGDIVNLSDGYFNVPKH